MNPTDRYLKGLPNYYPEVREIVTGDVFENAIRKIGVVSACEWFGHRSGDEFILDVIILFDKIAAGNDPRKS